jgi:hypothetical protein
VSGRSAEGDAQPDAPLLGDHDRVQTPPAAQVERGTAALTDGVGHAVEELRVLLDQVAGACLAAVLLVGDHGRQHVAGRWRAPGLQP